MLLQVKLIIPADKPALVYLEDFLDPHGEVSNSLTYRDLKADYVYSRFKRNYRLRDRLGPEKYEKTLQELKAAVQKTLLEEVDGKFQTLAGLSSYLSKKTGIPVSSEVSYPDGQKVPWGSEPEFEMHPFQQEIVEKLIEGKHGRIEVGTGLGKSFCILHIIRLLGLKTVIMAPNSSIAEQLYLEFAERLGKKLVGMYFDGKKEFKKQFTIGNAQSLTRIKPASPAWKALSTAKVFIADESHQCPAATLAKVCTGLCVSAPYRFFFSATQLRSDGLTKMLDGITGPTVYSKTVKEGVDEGYLARPIFRFLNITSSSNFVHSDANEMTRHHLYYNDEVIAPLAALINSAARAGYPVLVLVKEVEQFTRLLPYLKFRAGFAHGALQEGNVDKVPTEYQESDPNALVREFNAGKLPILVGTSCISTGTNVKAVKLLVYWRGNKSEIDVRQGIGRGTRLFPGKTTCQIIDIDVTVPAAGRKDVVHKHALMRREIYEDVYGPVRDIV